MVSTGSAGTGCSRFAVWASRFKAATSSSRLRKSSFLGRRPGSDPTTYSQKSGNPIVESQYATTVSGRTPGLTLPQLTASAGVAPDKPPQTTWSVVSWMKKSLPPLGIPYTSQSVGCPWR
jgi:hypothetical protein